MVTRKKEGALTAHEKTIVKALLNKGRRNQDIQALINIDRPATINSARISEVKKNKKQKVASDDEVAFYEIKKQSIDTATGLNLFDDERLIRAREAMILAVQIFNSAAFRFKTEVFSVLVNIAWTYLLHEFYKREKINIVQKDGRSFLLSQMVERSDCPLSDGAKNNLRSLKIIRDEVEHKLLGKSDVKWFGLFQACCLNFDESMCKLFGEQLTLAHELSFALQFSRMNVEQLSQIHKYEIPSHIEAVDARLNEKLSEDDLADLEYQFRVIYTMDTTSKSRSHFEFVRPGSEEGKEIRNVLVQHKIADQLYPHKPRAVVRLVELKSGKAFTSHNHTQAWKLFKVRPRKGANQPENTDKEFCIYHAAHGDYTYSNQWVEYLVGQVNEAEKFTAIKAVKV